MVKILTNTERDLINALTIDYLNIYVAYPDRDSIDIIKLNGYKPEESVDKWTNLSFTKLVGEYAASRVHPKDKTRFIKVCSKENVIKELEDKPMFQGRYRVLENGETHYFHYKFVKVSDSGEPIRAVAAFRNVDSFEAQEQKQLEELMYLRRIIASNDMGTWRMYVKEGQPVRMVVDSKMRELMGIKPTDQIREEDIAQMVVGGVHPDDLTKFFIYNDNLRKGKRTECTYRWNHPTIGERHIRCGGIAIPSDDGFECNGYHLDVTDQMQKEIRSQLIIKSLAHSYVFVNYIDMKEKTFFTYSENEIQNESLLHMLFCGDIETALRIGCEERVSDEFKETMRVFSDLKTMNRRLRHSAVINQEFKDVDNKWYECSFAVAERNEDRTIKYLLWGVRKIDDEKQDELRKQVLLEESIAANQAKTAFLQNMSHEIRTPLNAMLGFAQLLGLPEGTWPEDERKQFNSYILNSYSMLDMLIGDIIDVADSEHGNYRINLSDINVNNVCRNAMMSVEYRVPAEVNLYYTTDLPDEYIINSDGRRIQQVLVNYLTNACKHTEKGEIHLRCSREEHPGRLTFSVTDTGTGVPKEMANIIFNRFIKLNQFVQGSGLGLNICQMIADKLGGEVYLDTTYTGGARFVFVIDDKVS